MNPRDKVQDLVQKAIIQCFYNKCNSKRSSKIEYISPQELCDNLPIHIDRENHVITHRNGQWQIKNKYINLYIAFQVITKSNETKRLIKHLIALHSARRRRKSNKDIYVPICANCNDPAIKFPAAKNFKSKHFCRVKGYFECNNYYRHKKPHEFTVGICLLNPNTQQPPTRYACAKCGCYADFVGYDLRLKFRSDEKYMNDEDEVKGDHRHYLCEACLIWVDCRLASVQPSVIYEELLYSYLTECEWKMNKYNNGLYCNFYALEEDENGYFEDVLHSFELRPYVKCVYVSNVISNKLYVEKLTYFQHQYEYEYAYGRENRNKTKNKSNNKQTIRKRHPPTPKNKTKTSQNQQTRSQGNRRYKKHY